MGPICPQSLPSIPAAPFLPGNEDCLYLNVFAPTNATWGMENRTVGVRIKGVRGANTHVENRIPCAASNPYLVMAGLIAGHGHTGTDTSGDAANGAGVVGLAPGAKILPVYKNDAAGNSAVPQGIRWAADHGAKVINISGGTYTAPGSSAPLSQAIAYAAAKGVDPGKLILA